MKRPHTANRRSSLRHDRPALHALPYHGHKIIFLVRRSHKNNFAEHTHHLATNAARLLEE